MRPPAVFAELRQQPVLNKRFGFQWNRDAFAIKGKGLVSPDVSRQAGGGRFLLGLDRRTICRVGLGVCSWDPNPD